MKDADSQILELLRQIKALQGGGGSFIPTSALDTDGTLAANSDAKVPSQKAVKTYVDANAGGTAKSILAIMVGPSSAGGLPLTAGNTFYAGPDSPLALLGNVGETDCEFVIPFDCTIRNLNIRTGDTPATNHYTATVFTVRKNGADTALTVTLTETVNTTSADSTHSVSFTAGDILTVSVAATGDPGDTSTGIVSISLEVDAQ